MAGRASLANLGISKPKADFWEGPTIMMSIKDTYIIKSPATIHKDNRISFLGVDGQEDEIPGLYKGIGTWLMTKPIMRPDIPLQNPQFRNPRETLMVPMPNDPLPTSSSTRSMDQFPKPFPFPGQIIDIVFRFQGRGVPELRDVVLKEQTVEVPSQESTLVKHFLGGRISIRMVLLEWDGPFISIMTSASLQKYQESFRSIDVDGSGSINEEELLQIFQQYDYGFTANDVSILVERYSSRANGEITFDDYCEMMEAEGSAGRAWY